MIIFLDIDGVVVHKDCPTRYSRDLFPDVFDPRCVSALNRLIKYYKAKIVVSSFWRYFHTEEEIRGCFVEYGVEGKIKDFCPKLTIRDWNKGREIKHWIEDNKYKGDYIVIDDMATDVGVDFYVPKEKFFHVLDGWEKGGLSDMDVDNFIMERGKKK